MQPPSLRDSVALQFDHAARQFKPIPLRSLNWALDDVGTLYGAILVERFRTYNSKLLNLSNHQTRLEYGAKQLAIALPCEIADLEHNAIRLLELNALLVQSHGDVSVVMLVSPGLQSQQNRFGTKPTCMMHLSELPFGKLHNWYQNGTDLHLGTCQAVPSECWQSQMKTRSRLPYFLSDSAALTEKTNSLALLTTTRGTIADTSVANVLLIDSSGQIFSPPKNDILVGCTLQAMEKLLNKKKVTITYRDIEPAELVEANEVLLTGSSGGIWFARTIDGQPIGRDKNRTTYERLKKLWQDHVGIDFVGQAASLTPPLDTFLQSKVQ